MNKEIGPIQNCSEEAPEGCPDWAKLSFYCSMEWEDLEKTDNKSIRTCKLCEQDVFLVENKRELKTLKKFGARHCVSIRIQDSNGAFLPLTGAPPPFIGERHTE